MRAARARALSSHVAAAAASSSPQELRSLYRRLLREAKRFPSMKRAAIYEDIRAEWREKRSLTDPRAVSHAVEVAVRGLATMGKYTRLDKRGSSWTVTLEQDPLGAGGRTLTMPAWGGAAGAGAGAEGGAEGADAGAGPGRGGGREEGNGRSGGTASDEFEKVGSAEVRRLE
jgi:hypothetical protein